MRAYDKSRILSVMNYIIMPALLGPVLGPPVGGYLVEYAGWHWIFLINVPIGLAGLWLTAKVMPDFYAADGNVPRFDVAGFLLFAAAAVGLSLAVELLNYPQSRLFALLCAAGGVFALWRYVRYAQPRGQQAIYPLKLGWVRTFRLGLLGNLFSRLGMAAVPFLLPLLLQVAFGRSATVSGWTLAPVALAALLAKPLIRPLISHFGYRTVLLWNTRLIGLLIMALALPDAATPLPYLLVLLFCLGMCNSLQYSAMNTLTIADLRPQQAASGSSLMTVNQQLAISFGLALGALLLNAYSRAVPAADIHTAFRYTFLSIGSVTFCASWIFSRLHPHDGDSLLDKA